MAEPGQPVYLPGVEHKQLVRQWRYRSRGRCDEVLAVGTLPGGGWWVSASWCRLAGEMFQGEGAEAAALERAHELMRQAREHPGRWVQWPVAGQAAGTVTACPSAAIPSPSGGMRG